MLGEGPEASENFDGGRWRMIFRIKPHRDNASNVLHKALHGMRNIWLSFYWSMFSYVELPVAFLTSKVNRFLSCPLFEKSLASGAQLLLTATSGLLWFLSVSAAVDWAITASFPVCWSLIPNPFCCMWLYDSLHQPCRWCWRRGGRAFAARCF